VVAGEHDDRQAQPDQRLTTPRLLGALLSGEGVSAGGVLACLSPTSPLLMRGALRFVEASGPAVDRPVVVAARLAGFLLGAPYWDPRNCSEGNEPARRGGADPELARAGHHLPALTP
jgi:hypothetical protein